MSGIKTVGWPLNAKFPWLVEEAGGGELMHKEFFAAEMKGLYGKQLSMVLNQSLQ